MSLSVFPSHQQLFFFNIGITRTDFVSFFFLKKKKGDKSMKDKRSLFKDLALVVIGQQ